MQPRADLVDATLATVRERGIVGTSEATIAERAAVAPEQVEAAGGGLGALLSEAARTISRQRVAVYADRLGAAATFAELADVARELHAEEHDNGNLAVLTQLLAGARAYPALGPALRESVDIFAEEVAASLERLLAGSALEDLLPTGELARSLSAGFLGLELVDAVTDEHDPGLFGALDTLVALADLVAEAGPMQRSLLRARLRPQLEEG